MREDTSKRKGGARKAQGPELAEIGLPLDELVRRGARDILEPAIEVEVELLLDEFEDVRLIDGRRGVVRNGYLPARETCPDCY